MFVFSLKLNKLLFLIILLIIKKINFNFRYKSKYSAAQNKKMIKFLFIIYILVESINAGCYMEHNTKSCRTKLRNLYDFGPAAGDQR